METSTAGTGLPDTVLGGRYELGDAIGRGGSATVYRGRDRTTGRAVAVKMFGPAVDGVPARRREREMELLSRLDHPGLVGVLDAGVADHERPFLVMELVDGLTLAACRGRGPLPAPQVARIGRELARALAHVHSHGITHRDVTPANVLLDGTGRARLTDFGIALLVDQTRITTTGAVIGTAAYMSPEQVCGEPVGPPTDVYALGLVLLEAVTGRVAYSGTGKEVAIARLARRPEIPADLPGPLAALLPEMTADRPDDRPTAAEVASALDDGDPRTMMVIVPSQRSPEPLPEGRRTAVGPPVAVPPGGRTAAGPPAPTGSPGSPLRRRPVLIAAGLLVAAGLAGAGAWSLTGSAPEDGRTLSPVATPPVGSVLPAPSSAPVPVRAMVPTSVPAAREAATGPTATGDASRTATVPSTREAAAPGNRAAGARGAEKGDRKGDRGRGGSHTGKRDGHGDAGRGRGHD
ncbi:serine/threonine-protein kinase [Pseudonocardia endophytica]|uniref:non-specific serine/threonine protein kinase n=1 Tax=Pseudonocardia endophytica TaxID=401976 RepID=A0A4R1I3X3_PSEEN|nr:serine/threonine-protein kinase [Pseudonocardia endophytica]TCK24712.1 serine/threonine protein kinase [Pseudonocardia endophytica]